MNDTAAQPAEEALILTQEEARVLACLIEKEITTPDQYPLSLNALKSACNQKSNRDPVLALDEATITEALDGLRYRHHLLWQVTLAGSRVPKFKHGLLDAFDFSERDVAILCELMLRGPQTPGQLRTHAQRLCSFPDRQAVDEVLRGLADCSGRALVMQIPPAPGHREPRFAHLLCGEDGLEAAGISDAIVEGTRPMGAPRTSERVAVLEHEVAALRDELAALRETFTAFRSQFD